nr:hypothetical protein [Tanacetum cinerariifolium]
MVRHTVYVSHIQQFWSTARVETTDGETKILAKVNGRQRTVFESSIRRHLKLNDEEDEIAFLIGDVRYGEAFPTNTCLDVCQDKENVAKTSVMSHEALPMVTSLGGGEGIMQQKIQELMDICTSLQRQHSLMEEREDAPNIEGMDQGEILLVRDTVKDSDKSADKGSDSTDEMANVLGTLGAANILASGGLSVATPTTRVTRSSRGVVIGSSSPIFVNIPSISKKDKEKGKMTEPEQPSKENVLEQMSVQLARDLEAKFAQEDQIIREQAERDSKISRIHAERELEMMIAELDRSNEMMQDFVPMNSKLESERLKRLGIQLDKESFKKLKTVEASGIEPTQEQQFEEPKELSEEELKKMIYTTEVTDEKAKEIYVELMRLYEPNSRDPLWALQRYMHDSLVWRLYDTCGVPHVSTGRGH